VESVVERVMDTKEKLGITLKSTMESGEEHWRALESIGEH
jgi:hypothetical protein